MGQRWEEGGGQRQNKKEGVWFVSTAPEICFLHLSAAFSLVFCGAPCLCSRPTSAVTVCGSLFCGAKDQEEGEWVGTADPSLVNLISLG